MPLCEKYTTTPSRKMNLHRKNIFQRSKRKNAMNYRSGWLESEMEILKNLKA
jgi:hypothetical protein